MLSACIDASTSVTSLISPSSFPWSLCLNVALSAHFECFVMRPCFTVFADYGLED